MSYQVWRIQREYFERDFVHPKGYCYSWILYNKGIDPGPGGTLIPWEQFDAHYGCVCHNPGPFDPYFRQPRLERYCTCKGCHEKAVFAVWPVGRRSEYACATHLDDMKGFFPNLLVWIDTRTSQAVEPEWQPWVEVSVGE